MIFTLIALSVFFIMIVLLIISAFDVIKQNKSIDLFEIDEDYVALEETLEDDPKTIYMLTSNAMKYSPMIYRRSRIHPYQMLYNFEKAIVLHRPKQEIVAMGVEAPQTNKFEEKKYDYEGVTDLAYSVK
jgi:hypothetical protein